MSADLLANAERPATERPAPSPERVDPDAGHQLGPAGQETAHWKARALSAEAQLDELRRQLARHRFRP
jgi:hypothetical protein